MRQTIQSEYELRRAGEVRTSDVGGRTMRNVEPAHRGQGSEASLARICG